MMTETRFTLGWPDFMNAVAVYLNYGREDDPNSPATGGWTDEQVTRLDRDVQAGYSQFCHPPGHVWSFMRVVGHLETKSGEADYLMPEDFGGIEGEMTYGANEGYTAIRHVPIAKIHRLRQTEHGGDRPTCMAIVPISTDGAMPERHQVQFWTEPGGNYHLTFIYHVNPKRLGHEYPYPLGGPRHAETILQSCVAMAEVRRENERGPQADLYNGFLMSSIEHDKKAMAPKEFGPMMPGRGMSEASAHDLVRARTYSVTDYMGLTS